MTKITVALLLMICIYQELPAATYYLSTISGDDLRTNTQAQRSSTPWKTLSRLQAYLSNLKAGDSILFKRGETFEGRLFILKSGTTNSPIVFSTYGSGDKPIINGFSTITSWSSLGKNIYKASLDAGVYLNILTVNNLVMAMGRWPNISEPDKGYLTIDNNAKSQDGNGKYTGGSFQDAALQKSPDWTGAQAVIRKRHWVIDRCRITRHAGSTISYITPSHHDINNGWGYFIQNSAATLDKHGEWFYDPADHTVRLYSTLPPSRLAVKAGAVDTLVYINNQSFITFDNLVFQGADTVAMKIVNGSSNIKIRNCDFRYCGMRAIVANASKNIEVENCLFVNSNNESLLFNDCSYSTIRNNTIKNIHLWRGMGEDNDGGSAIALVHEKNSLVEFNNLDSLGATGIAFLGSFITVKNNLVKNFT
ncbi:MAG: right-handed parallel beta-helix repeat-containing protein, partial [Chitinophagaceae bacterium]